MRHLRAFSLDVRRSAWEEARISSANLVAAIESDIERNISLYDLSLLSVVEISAALASIG